MSTQLTIGQVAELSGVPTRTIRHYENVGVLPEPRRSESNYRLYAEVDLRRLDLVRRARMLDMALSEVRELVEWAGSGDCNDFQGRFLGTIRRKLEEVDRHIAELESLKNDLSSLGVHLTAADSREVQPDHTMLGCPPETCTCLGDRTDHQSQRQEVVSWLDKPK